MTRPNIVMIVSDQERQRDWFPAGFPLPNRQRILDAGLEFTNHYTHTSPCSPSRATMFTGEYLPAHGVTENSTQPVNTQLSRDANTLGHLLRASGYRTAYKGKWHLESGPHPDMDAFGFGDWQGNDHAYLGLPGAGTEFDEPIARQAAEWLGVNGDSEQPWFLVVGLVNPHDIMWYPVDQPWYWERDPEYAQAVRDRFAVRDWGRAENLPIFDEPVDPWFTELPANFADDLSTKPEVHKRWMEVMVEAGTPGVMAPDDTDAWLWGMDYYAKLHQISDRAVGVVLDAVDALPADDTIVIFTSDHGDQCASHGLRSKGPWNYDETMRIPLYIDAPGRTTPGSATESLTSHIDLAATVADLAGIDLGGESAASLAGESLAPLFDDQQASVRDHVLFVHEWAYYLGVEQTRYASTGIFDGRYKYCRYYGVGGGHDAYGRSLGDMQVGRDAAFDDHEHELYDLVEDPHEMVNLAADPARRNDLRRRFSELRAIEHTTYGHGF